MAQQFHPWVYIPKKWKILIGKDSGTPVFIEAFTIPKTGLRTHTYIQDRKPHTCPSADERIKGGIAICTQWNTLRHRKEIEFPCNMDGLGGYHVERNKSKKEKHCMSTGVHESFQMGRKRGKHTLASKPHPSTLPAVTAVPALQHHTIGGNPQVPVSPWAVKLPT